MKKIFFLIAVLFSFTGMAQTVGQLRYDTVKMYKVGGTTELILQNASSGVVGGVLRNVINGRTVFQAVVDSIYSNATQDSIVYVIAGTRRAFKYSSGGGGSGWGLSGNAGTTPGTNFIGTTDAKGFMAKVNNVQSFYLDLVNFNASFGLSSMLANTTGVANTAFGNFSLLNNTIGTDNTGIGYSALSSNLGGSYNQAFGRSALAQNTTGIGNVGVGFQSATNTTTGSFNTSIGNRSLYTNITGSSNTAIGDSATTATSSTDSSVAIGFEAVASTRQVAFSPYVNTMYLNLDSASGTAPAIAGIDANGNWRKYATPSGSGGVTLSQMNDSLAAIRDTIQFDGTMNVNTVGQLTTAGVDTSVVATRRYADSVAAASGGGTAIPNNEIAFGNGTGITSNSDFFYSTGSGGLFNVGFSGNVILQKTGNNYYFGDKDGINNQTYLHVNDGSKLVTVNADSLKLGSVKVALQATDSTGSPTNMIYQGTDGLFHKAAVPSGSGGSPAGNYGNLQINRNGAFDTPGGDSLSWNGGLSSVGDFNNILGTGESVFGDGAGDVFMIVSGVGQDGNIKYRAVNGHYFETGDVTVSQSIIAHNIIGATATQTDANFSATAGTAYVLSGNNSATRTITMPTLAEGDVFEFYNENTSANKWVSSATIYLSDSTTFTTLADDTNYILRYVGGKLRVSN